MPVHGFSRMTEIASEKAMIGPVACEDQSDLSATCECENVLQCVCIMPISVCLVWGINC